jgi:hypothetical protein
MDKVTVLNRPYEDTEIAGVKVRLTRPPGMWVIVVGTLRNSDLIGPFPDRRACMAFIRENRLRRPYPMQITPPWAGGLLGAPYKVKANWL